ncbi:MAG: HEAT repeat domain-containing protein [Thermodesulfobacteriota bacterium]
MSRRTRTVTTRVARQEMPSATIAENTEVVRAAAQALGLLGDPDALWTLVDLAELRPEGVLVGAAAQAIARIGTEAAAEFLEKLALDEAPARRACAAEALEFLSGAEAPAVLWPLLRDEDPQVRRCAAASLGRRPPGEIWERLRQALCDPGEVLRDGALAVLRGQVDRDGFGPDEVEALAQWAQAGADAETAADGCLGPVAEEAARARSRLERRQREAHPPEPPAPRPARTLAAEIGPDGVPVYRPVRHRVLGENGGVFEDIAGSL